MIMVSLPDIVKAFAQGLKNADSRKPKYEKYQAGFAESLKHVDNPPVDNSQRPKCKNYQAGIGPFPEPKAIALIIQELSHMQELSHIKVEQDVFYPDPETRQKCDICIFSNSNHFDWAIEVKLLRFLGDNGKPNDNMLTHILSPYPQHKSALNDCVRLAKSSFAAKKAILIYGFEHDEWPLEPAIEAFEHLANEYLANKIPVKYQLGTRYVSCFTGLIHPIHTQGKVFGWELQVI